MVLEFMTDDDVDVIIERIMDILSWTISDYKCRRQEIYKVVCEELAEYPGNLVDVNVATIASQIRRKLR